jgi:hypothetical protein
VNDKKKIKTQEKETILKARAMEADVSEFKRRNREAKAARQRVLKPCRMCGKMLSTEERRKACKFCGAAASINRDQSRDASDPGFSRLPIRERLKGLLSDPEYEALVDSRKRAKQGNKQVTATPKAKEGQRLGWPLPIARE